MLSFFFLSLGIFIGIRFSRTKFGGWVFTKSDQVISWFTSKE